MPETTLPTEDRQLLALALAQLTRARPGWAYAVEELAARLFVSALYESFLRVAPSPPEPLRLYRWADAPPEFQALSDLGGGEVLVAVVPPAWQDETWRCQLPYALWLLLAADTVHDWPQIERTWGAVQRVPQGDGSTVIIVAWA